MKMKLQHIQRGLLLIVLGVVGITQAARAGEPTAFDLIKEGNRYIGEDSKDKVVQIRSEKSVATLTPNIWYVVYYDPDATLLSVEVKFAGGRKQTVKRPTRLLEPVTRAHKELDREKFKVDSDKALDIATKEPILKDLTLKASRMSLERRNADDNTPVWKVRLWAAKLKNPNDNVDIGEVIISAEDGKVLKSDLRPNKVD